jgi:hypothetical protein
MSVTGNRRVRSRPSDQQVRREELSISRPSEADPFAGAIPVEDLAVLAGGLPDDRDAEEILGDLARCRAKSRRRR